MKFTRLIALALIAASCSLGAAQANSLRDADQPTEVPPSSYTGRQYVDSQGCIFARADIDGNVFWVPRVTRARKMVCGQQPSLPIARAPEPAATPAPVPSARPQPKNIAAASTPRVAVQRAPVQAVASPVRTARAPTPRSVTATPVTRVPGARAVRVTPRAIPAPGRAAPVHAAPMHGGTGYAIGAAYPPRDVVRVQKRADGVIMPEGYKRVWMDGRGAPQRAHQTNADKTTTERVWTTTLPRRLILLETGREVTADYPGLIYPHTSYEEQRAAKSGRSTRASNGRAVIAPPKARAASHSYVQAGVYTSRAQARQAAQRLAGSGLPTHLGRMTRGGTQYSLVLSGPYTSQSALDGALVQVRRAGFRNARLR